VPPQLVVVIVSLQASMPPPPARPSRQVPRLREPSPHPPAGRLALLTCRAPRDARPPLPIWSPCTRKAQKREAPLPAGVTTAAAAPAGRFGCDLEVALRQPLGQSPREPLGGVLRAEGTDPVVRGLWRACPLTGLRRLPGRPGADGASPVLRRRSACLPWPVDSGGPPPARQGAGLGLPAGAGTPSASAPSASRSCTRTAGGALTPTASRRHGLRFAHLVRRGPHHDSAMDARLATGGGLALPPQGLSLCKRRQACLAR
jgi:hypothetical protein